MSDRVCAVCGTTATAGQRFCAQCGSPLPAETASPIAERRLVSVLFADLVGFTTFSEARDAEDVQELQGRYFEAATKVVARYGGTIEKFIGDAVMAVWGTPTAHEDDAERAVRAALELVAAVPALAPGLEARCGVLTGEAAVMLGAANQGMVTGDIVNTAARLQSAAAPSTVLVGEATLRAAAGAVVFEPAGLVSLKGKAQPVETWRALGAAPERRDPGRIEGVEAPFVGRDAELATLREAFQLTASERQARHVSILGTGGIGKSRLVSELERYAHGIDPPVSWNRGRAPAYGEGITFWSLGEMIRRRAGLVESDDDATTRARIDTVVDESFAEHADRDRIHAALLQMLGIPAGIPADELFSAWRAFFERLAASGTVVLVFEDQHWADPGTLEFIDDLIDWSRSSPILVVSLARPELLDRRPDWAIPRRGHTTLVLEPLPIAETQALLGGLVAGLPTQTSAAIASRAAGVPLYAVELVRMLLARGQLRVGDAGILETAGEVDLSADLALPETLTALISSRLDALAPDDRSLVLDAAVLGQTFAPAGLAAVSGRTAADLHDRLRELVRREVLTPIRDPQSPERGQYAFVQSLIREVAYRTLAKRNRVTRHLAVADWLETLDDPELAGAVAGHLVAARELMPPDAAAAVSGRARRALRAAAARATSLGTPGQAVSFLDQALAMMPEPAEEGDLLEFAGAAALNAAAFTASEGYQARAVELQRRLGDRVGIARTTAGLARSLLAARRFVEGRAVLAPVLSELADLPDTPDSMQLLSQQARALFLSAELVPAIELGRSIIERARAIGDTSIELDALITVGSALGILGNLAEGRPMLRRARELADAKGMSQVVARALNNEFLALMDEDPVAAFDLGQEGIALAIRIGQRQTLHSLTGAVCWIGVQIGRWQEGEALAVPVLDVSDEPMARMDVLNSLTALWLLRGRHCDDEVAELVATAAEYPDSEASAYRDDVLGYRALVEGRIDDARAVWRPLATNQMATGLVTNVAHLDIWRGDADSAERLLASAGNYPNEGASAVIRSGLAAGIAGLRGDRAAALAGYATLGSQLRDYELAFEEVMFSIDMVRVIGLSYEVTRAQVDIARATIDRVVSPPLKRLLDDAVRSGSPRSHDLKSPRTSAH